MGQNSKALYFTKEALLNNPNDEGLLLTAASIYLKIGDENQYKKLIEKASIINPENSTLMFNLGVIASDSGDKNKAAEKYYKAIELDPENENAYLNLIALILEEENQIVNEMNNLGNSPADDIKYQKLNNYRLGLYQSCVPLLEKLISISKNIEAIKTLKNIYSVLGNNKGVKEMEQLLKRY